MKKVAIFGVLLSILTLSLSPTSFAHITVKPSEVETATYQTFTISVPNEKAISTISVRLEVPNSLESIQPTQETGWQITTGLESSDENEKVKSITWSGNEIIAGQRGDFTFSAKVPAEASELQWRAYQTYSDGSVVAWDKDLSSNGHQSHDENSGPFSVTKVVDETAQSTALKEIEQNSIRSQSTANTALYIAVAGVVVGLIGVFFGTRSR